MKNKVRLENFILIMVVAGISFAIVRETLTTSIWIKMYVSVILSVMLCFVFACLDYVRIDRKRRKKR